MSTSAKPVALYIDPPSHHFLRDRLFDAGDGRFVGSYILAPYVYLRDYLQQRGITAHTADLMPKTPRDKRIVYISFGMLKNYPRLARRPDVSLSACFAMECPIVDPSIYRGLNRAQHHFKRILTWSDSASLERFVGGPLRCETFKWPQSFDDVHEELWRQTDRRFLIMINSNKLPRLFWCELYTERLRAVTFFSRHNEIDLYGVGWDEPQNRMAPHWVPYTARRLRHHVLRYWQKVFPDPLLVAARRVYRGRAASKSQTLAQYTFALCFENMILKGWITEKIFDCFFSGTIPIYWGAPDIEQFVPPDCFIDMRRFADYAALRAYLKALTPQDIARYRDNARAFLKSPAFFPFSRQAFAERIAQIIEQDSGISL